MQTEDKNNKDKFFGNKTILFGGDFRQVLPVVVKGNRSSIVKASLKHTSFWKSVTCFKLTINMRIQSAAKNSGKSTKNLANFSEFLLKIGQGLIPALKSSRFVDDIQLPIDIAKNIDEMELINKVFPDLKKNYLDSSFMTTRAILTPKNKDVTRINSLCAKMFPGNSRTYYSIDFATTEQNKRN
jgi:hypothetical protein